MSARERTWKGIAQELQQGWSVGGHDRARVWFDNYAATRDKQHEDAVRAAEARGFERARDMAERVAVAYAAEMHAAGRDDRAEGCEEVADRIRDMQDEQGREAPVSDVYVCQCGHDQTEHWGVTGPGKGTACMHLVRERGNDDDRCPCAGFTPAP